jgi:hypothetical protein
LRVTVLAGDNGSRFTRRLPNHGIEILVDAGDKKLTTNQINVPNLFEIFLLMSARLNIQKTTHKNYVFSLKLFPFL